MQTVEIRDAQEPDIPALDAALRQLSTELGDPHRAGPADLHAALFGMLPAAHACLSEDGAGLRGLALYTPLFSTMRGGAGLFVSDLWVRADLRGSGLGRAILRAAFDRAATRWHARFLRLIVHDHNARADAFYRGLGFDAVAGETALVLSGPALDRLRSIS
jgi:ribosomal protein S18 acetylase RimI-like enzyme